MDNFTIRQGESLPLLASLTDDQGDPITDYAGTEALAAICWPGGNLAASFAPAVAWVSGPLGTINVEVSAAQTAGLAEGRHFGSVTLTDPDLGPLEAYTWTMDIVLAAGTGTANGLAYVGFGDLIKHARTWLRTLQDQDATGGFVLECADASRWLDDLILARYPSNNSVILGDPGYGSMVWGMDPGMLPNQWLIALLASGGLILRPKVIEAVAKRALSYIAKGQIGVGDSKADYRTLGRIMETESSAIAMTLVAELCTDGSGVPNLGIPLGGTSMRPQFGA